MHSMTLLVDVVSRKGLKRRGGAWSSTPYSTRKPEGNPMTTIIPAPLVLRGNKVRRVNLPQNVRATPSKQAIVTGSSAVSNTNVFYAIQIRMERTIVKGGAMIINIRLPTEGTVQGRQKPRRSHRIHATEGTEHMTILYHNYIYLLVNLLC